jgi:hypothetical protein
METTQAINELLRLPSPAPLPFGLAADGDTLWMASRETQRLYAIAIKQWTVREEAEAPGGMFGMTMVGDELRVIVGVGDNEHDRYIARFIPGHGFKSERIACPDLTGNQLAFDGDTIFLSQAHYQRILALDAQGNVLREIPLPGRRPAGMTIADGAFYLLSADGDWDNLEFWKLDAHGERPAVTVLASVPFDGRGLTYDGSRFWTSHRDNNEIVAFTV